jgi:hypothetical protein
MHFLVNAKMKHIFKFSQGYDKLFPSAQQVVVLYKHYAYYLPSSYSVSLLSVTFPMEKLSSYTLVAQSGEMFDALG